MATKTITKAKWKARPAKGKRASTTVVTISQKTGEFNVKHFCTRYKVVRPDLTRMTGYSLRSVDKWAAGERMTAVPKRRMAEIERLLQNLAEIMEPASIGGWLKTPNSAFEGSTPLQLIERGETDRIWRMIFLIETGEPI